METDNSPSLQQSIELKDENKELNQEQNEEASSILGEKLIYCVVSEEEMNEKQFLHSHELTTENYEMFKTIIDNFDSDFKLKDDVAMKKSLKVSDSIFEFVERRFKKYHSQDEYATYNKREIAKNIAILVVMSLLIVVFLLLSALPIWAIEGGNEFLENLKANNGTNGTRNEKWTYGNSIYYCLVTFTTIGYGDFVASTIGGRIYICIFGIIGIGILGTLLVAVGKTTTGNVKAVLLLVSMGFYKIVSCVKKAPNHKLKKSDRLYRFLFHPVTQLLYYTFFWLCYIFICAAIFMAIEGWTYGNATWYCFVTLGTIGYGDFYPTNAGGKVFFMFFAVIGLGFEAVMIGLISELASDWIKAISTKFNVWQRRRREKKENSN